MDYKLRYKRRLPHYQPIGGIFFITFRLNFDLPIAYRKAYQDFKEKMEIQNGWTELDENSENNHRKRLFGFQDDLYGKHTHEISLIDNDSLAMIVADKLLALQETMYYLYCWTIMPNHVHFLIRPKVNDDVPVPLSEIMQLIKGGTSRQINLVLSRKGALWYHEFFDYCVRTESELYRIIDYIRFNPVKAGLVKDPGLWKWTWMNPDLMG